MLNFNSYNGAQLQVSDSILAQCEADGVTDIGVARAFIKDALAQSIKGSVGKVVPKTAGTTQHPAKSASLLCPSCRETPLTPAVNFKGVCCKCGYSKMSGV